MKLFINTLFIFLLFFTNYSFAKEKKRVLILHSYHQSYKWTNDINKGINFIFQDENKSYEFYYEYMDTKRFVDDKHYKNLLGLYRNKYQILNIDLIIASDNNAFNFLKKYSDILFSEIPIVLCGINYLKKEDIEHLPNFIGVNEKADIKENFDLIIKNHPDVKNIYLITDTTTTGKTIKDEALKVIFNYPNKHNKFFIVNDVSYEELQIIAKNLPQNSVLLYAFFNRDKNGKFLEFYEASTMLNKLAKVPMYGLWDFSLDNGIIGGFLTSGYFQGRTAALMGQKILKGQNIKNIESEYRSPNQYMFDYKEIEKFNIDKNLIPKSSFIINKKTSFYKTYKSEINSISIMFIMLIIFILILLTYIGKIKKAEKTIKKQLNFQQDLIDNVNTPIYYKNKEEEFIGCNKAFQKMIQKNEHEIINKTSYDIFEKEQADDYHLKDLEILSTANSQQFESSYKFKNTKRKDVIIYKNVFYEDNKIAGIIGAIFDITELKKATKKLDILNKSLEEEVKIRTTELKMTNDELEDSNEELQTTIYNLKETQNRLIESEKMASLGSLVAGVAHEINTPVGIGLTGITHFIDQINVLKKEYENNTMSEDTFENFLSKSLHIGQIINSNLNKTAQLIRSFKQVAIDQTNDEKRDINLKNYINETIFSLGSITKKIKIDLICEDSFIINTYPGSISQIISNLIINSTKHAFGKNEKGNISIEISKENDYCNIIYKDNGKGVKEENINKIFDPFFTTNREHGGTGLGLNIIYNIIVNTLSGSIICKSEENEGIEFNIKFMININ